jgi:hypothetical protein
MKALRERRPRLRRVRRIGSANAGAALGVGLVLAASAALAQESTNVLAATQPSVGSFYLRERLKYMRLGDDPSPADRTVDKVVATTSLAYGLTRDWSLSLEMPLVYERSSPTGGSTAEDVGLSDLLLAVKWRPWQLDLGPVDSLRFAMVGGVEIASGDGEFSSDSFDPSIGGVFTGILGRHGFNAAAIFKHNTGGDPYGTRAGDGPADAVRLEGSYLFRLIPAAYAVETTAATYLTFELNSLYETNGDWELIVGPGILYEARTFALEAAVGLPVLRAADERPTTDLVLTVGARFLF